MSYDISLKDPVTKETIEVKDAHFMRGGTYALGGTKELWLNVTYNYGRIFRRPEVLGEVKASYHTYPIFPLILP